MATQNQGEQAADAALAPSSESLPAKTTNANDDRSVQQQQQKKNKLKRPRPPVAVITTTGCPFCSRIKGALNFAGVAFDEVDLASSPDALAAVKAATGRSTVPQVFVGGRLLGGCDEALAALADGTFQAALKLAAEGGDAALPAAIAAAVKQGRVGGAGIGSSSSGLSGGETSDDDDGGGSGGSGEGGLGGGGGGPMTAAEIKRAKAAARAAADDPGLRPEGMPADVYVSLRALEASMAAGDGTGLSPGAGAGESFSVANALEWLRGNGDRISSSFSSSPSSSSFFPSTAEGRLDALAAARFVAPPYGAAVGPSPSLESNDSSPATETTAAAPSSFFPSTAVSTLPLGTPLLLARRAPPARPPLSLNARVSWLGPARSAPLVASGMRTRILALYDAHLAEDGRGVDYTGLLSDSRFADFCCAAAELQALKLRELEALPPAERAALFINVYNAMIVHATAERGAPADSPAARAAFFGSAGGAAYLIAGFDFTADDVEHGVLRCNAPSVGSVGGALRLPWATHFPRGDPRAALALPQLDARVHAALNCGARSCPPIKVYAAGSLSEALDGAMCALCGDARVDERARTVELSTIFKWYARDFAADGATPLLPWLARYLPPAPAAALGRLLGDGGPPPKIQYAPYDWGSNDGTS